MTIEEVLVSLGYKLHDRGTYWQAAALYRNGDNETALQIYKDSGTWKDYVEDTPYLPFASLVQKTLGTNDPDVLRKYGKDKLTLENKPKCLLKEAKTYDPSCLKKLLPHYDFYLERGIEKEILEERQCGLATNGKFYQRLTFPIFNSEGRIHGFSGRAMGERTPKWLHIGKKNDWFYPFHTITKTKEAIRKTNSVLIVESIGDSLALSNAGIYNHLVSFGISVSPSFISRLSGLGVDYIGVAFNNDDQSDINRGQVNAAKTIVKLSRFFDLDKLWITPPDKNDFGDMSKSEVIDWYEGILNDHNHKRNIESVVPIIDSEIKNGKGFSAQLKKSFKKFKERIDFYYGE